MDVFLFRSVLGIPSMHRYMVAIAFFGVMSTNASAQPPVGPPYVWTTPTAAYSTSNTLDIRADVYKYQLSYTGGMFMWTPHIVARIPYGPNIQQVFQNPNPNPAPGQPQTITYYGYNSTNNYNSGTYMFIVQIYNGANVQVLQNFSQTFP